MQKWRKFFVLGLLSCFTLLLSWVGFALPSAAHWSDLSVAEVLVGQTEAQVTLTLPSALLSFADTDRNGELSPPEVQAHREQLQAFFSDRLVLKDASYHSGNVVVQIPDSQQPTSATPNLKSHQTVFLTYTWPSEIAAMTIDYRLFVPGQPEARCLATIVAQGRSHNVVFTPQQQTFQLNQNPLWQTIGSFMGLGIEHIFTGYDHILFLLSLMLVGVKLQTVLKWVTAFTIAHSLTLSLTTLYHWTLPGRWVESVIALSIVYVAIENLWRKSVPHRWLLTFGFGLVHGFGFAGILQSLAIAPEQLPVALASFNVGVELGQVAIITLIFLGLQWIQRQNWVSQFQKIMSLGLVTIGLWWFVQRAFLTA